MPVELPFLVTEFIANFAIESLVIRASCKLLDIRRPIAYGAVIYALTLVAFALNATNSTSTLSRLLIGLSSTFFVPIAMSSKPMGSRILRSLLVLVGLSVGEFTAQLVFSFFTGLGNYPNEASQASTILVIVSYAASVYAIAITFEILIRVCSRSQYQTGLAIELPIILLNACSHIVLFMLSMRIAHTNTNSPLLAAITLGAIFSTLLISLSTLEIAQRDMAAAKENADRVALARQVRHIKSELTSIARHSARVRQLRHDLANQIGTVNELLDRGQSEAAGLYLTQLQRHVDNLIEEKAERR